MKDGAKGVLFGILTIDSETLRELKFTWDLGIGIWNFCK
jgi:hypothetical protein